MFQRQYEDDAEVVADSGDVIARGYARLVLASDDDGPTWRGTFRVTEPETPRSLDGRHLLRTQNGGDSEALFAPTEGVQGEVAGRAGTFFEVTGVGPAPF